MTSRKTVWLFAMIVCLSCSMMGCKTGTKIDNPFAKKPKLPSADTPAAIDGIQLSAPPEKYSKELTKNGDTSGGKLAQKGKYESESTGSATPQMAMNNSYNESIPPYNSGSTVTTQPVSASVPVASAMPSSYPASSYPIASQTAPSSYPLPASQATPSSYPPATNSYPVASSPYPATSSPYPTMATNTNTPYPATAPYPVVAPAQNPTAPYPAPYPTSPMQATQAVTGNQNGNPSVAPTSNHPYPAPGFSSEPVYPVTNPGYYAAPTTGFAPGSIGGGY